MHLGKEEKDISTRLHYFILDITVETSPQGKPTSSSHAHSWFRSTPSTQPKYLTQRAIRTPRCSQRAVWLPCADHAWRLKTGIQWIRRQLRRAEVPNKANQTVKRAAGRTWGEVYHMGHMCKKWGHTLIRDVRTLKLILPELVKSNKSRLYLSSLINTC